MVYEVRFLNHGGLVFSQTTVSAATDRQAIESAHGRLQGGPGYAFQIWRDGTLIHTEQLDWDGASQTPSAFRSRVRDYISMALGSGDLQYRRLLMVLAEMLLGLSESWDADRTYTVVLSGNGDDLPAELVFPADDNRQAFAMASILADACSDCCTRFELWCGQDLLGSATRPFRSPAGHLRERSQRIVVERELVRHESCNSIVESEKLLRRIDRWLAAGMVGQA